MQVKVLGVERRRRWSYDEKVRLVEETLQAGETVCAVARRHGVAPSLLFTWRRQARLALRQAPGSGKVYLALGLSRCGVNLDGADGLYARGHRLEESTTDLAAAERWLSGEICGY